MALVATDEFRDLIEIGRQNRTSLYDLTGHRPPPLVARELRFVVPERMGPEGVVMPPWPRLCRPPGSSPRTRCCPSFGSTSASPPRAPVPT